MPVPRPYLTDPFHSLSSILIQQQFLYIRSDVLIISSNWYLKGYLEVFRLDNCTCALAETLISKFRAIIKVFFSSILYVDVLVPTRMRIFGTNEMGHYLVANEFSYHLFFWFLFVFLFVPKTKISICNFKFSAFPDISLSKRIEVSVTSPYRCSINQQIKNKGVRNFFCRFLKSHFSNLRSFFQPFYAQNKFTLG